jgi:hypothetical protein
LAAVPAQLGILKIESKKRKRLPIRQLFLMASGTGASVDTAPENSSFPATHWSKMDESGSQTWPQKAK